MLFQNHNNHNYCHTRPNLNFSSAESLKSFSLQVGPRIGSILQLAHPPTWTDLSQRTCEKKVTVGDEIFSGCLIQQSDYLKTHRPWYTYQLTPYQVIEPEVPYVWRKIWLFDSWYEEKILAVQCCVLFLCAVSLQVVSVLTLLWKGNTKIKLLCVLHITLHKKTWL